MMAAKEAEARVTAAKEGPSAREAVAEIALTPWLLHTHSIYIDIN